MPTIFDLQISDTWYGKTGTAYEGVKATIIDINPYMVIVIFNQVVKIKGKSSMGKEFGHRNFVKLFDKKNEQMSFPFLDKLN